MTRQIYVENYLEDEIPASPRDLAPFLKSILKRRSVETRPDIEDPSILWPYEFFGLDSQSIYGEADSYQQHQILKNLCQSKLEEALYIEKSGMTYAAKMALLAKNPHERSLYNMLSADEALHFQMIASWVPEPRAPGRQPFLKVLNQVVENGGYASLIFVAQVLLEGWGLSHYLGLYKSCLNPHLQASLKSILKDEAIHHGSGLVLTKQNPFIGGEKDLVYTIIHDFFQLVRLGPLGLATEIAEASGGLTSNQSDMIFQEHDAQRKIHADLKTLTELIEEHSPDPDLSGFVRAQGLDQPASAQEFREACKTLI